MSVTEPAPMQQIVPDACTTIENYPHEGILFYDVTTLFANAKVFKQCIDELARRFEGTYDVVAGVEARGFLLASALAYATGKGIMTVRKAGKLPRETFREEYSLEYGTAAVEIHCNDAAKLVERAQLQVAGIGVLLELDGLGGRTALESYHIESLSAVTE